MDQLNASTPKSRTLPALATSITTGVDVTADGITIETHAWTSDGQCFLVDMIVAPLTPEQPTDTNEALIHLWRMAQGYSSSEKAAAHFLLSLYNGYRFKFDLTGFRLFDGKNFRRCMKVLAMDHMPKAEVHVMLARALGRHAVDVGNEFEHLAFNHRIKGAVKKADLPALREEASA